MPENGPKKKLAWREAALWALLVALMLEFAINLFSRQTLWHRIDALEHRVEHLEHIHEQQDEDMRRRLQDSR